MYSLVINIAKLVIGAVEEVITIAMLGFPKEILEVVIVDADPNKVSVIINKTFFLFKLLYLFL